MPLTDVAIRSARPTEKAQRLFDGLGLYLEISPAGGRWWRFKYRYGGKEKRLSLGTYPEVTLKPAREARDEARKLLAAGIDPGQQRKADKTAERDTSLYTVRKAVAAWLAHMKGGWTKGTYDAIEASFVLHVFPKYGDLPAASVTPSDVRNIVKAVDDTGAGETAGRVFQRLHSVYRYAITNSGGRVIADPTYSLKPSDILKPRKVKHRASMPPKEVPAFLRALEAYGGEPETKYALALIVLTVVRPGELTGGEWTEIEWESNLWRIPGPRMKMDEEHLVPLSDQALGLLRTLHELTGHRKLILPSPFYPTQSLSANTLNSALARMGYKGIATAHGFRTLFSTQANEAGFRADVIEKQLSHEERDQVRGAYNRAEYMAERVKLMQWWADRLDQLRKGADVIPIKAA